MKILMVTIQTEQENLNFFDDMITDIMTNRGFQAIIKELITSRRKLNISHILFLSHSLFFSVPKDVRLNSTYCLIMKINNRKEL